MAPLGGRLLGILIHKLEKTVNIASLISKDFNSDIELFVNERGESLDKICELLSEGNVESGQYHKLYIFSDNSKLMLCKDYPNFGDEYWELIPSVIREMSLIIRESETASLMSYKF